MVMAGRIATFGAKIAVVRAAFVASAGTGLLLAASAAATDAALAPRWSASQVGALRLWANAAPSDALPVPDMRKLETAIAAGDAAAIDREARSLALRLARLHLHGSAGSAARKGWRISDAADSAGLDARLDGALTAGRLSEFFEELRPSHPEYAALRQAYQNESDPARRALLVANMERWRWMPQNPGRSFLLVNAAAFEATLWREGERSGQWRVIVGKPKTSTPTFAATVTGVTLNPWWDVPASIVRESVGALVRRNPALARQRGYVWSGGRIRQKPGPGNALGRMKLVMPNPYSVYLHDTPNRALFEEEVRTFSHGCVRVGNALGLAETLLAGVKTRGEIDAVLAAGQTTTVPLAAPVPVYVAYFTASVAPDGTLTVHGDPYGRDKAITGTVTPAGFCAADAPL